MMPKTVVSELWLLACFPNVETACRQRDSRMQILKCPLNLAAHVSHEALKNSIEQTKPRAL